MDTLMTLLLGDEELSQEVVQNLVGKLKPALYALGNEIQTVLRDYVNNEEFFELRAQTKWKLYDAYVKAGFDAEQAMTLITNDGIAGEAISHLLPTVAEAFTEGMEEYENREEITEGTDE